MKKITKIMTLAALVLTSTLAMAQNAPKAAGVSIDTAQVTKMSAYVNFHKNDSTAAYYVYRSTPAEYDSLIANQVDLYTYISAQYDASDCYATYGDVSYCTSDTTLYIGSTLPNSTMRVIALALESDTDHTGMPTYLDITTDYAGGEGVAGVTYHIYQVTSSGFRFDIYPDSNCAYWYMNIYSVSEIADSGWTTPQQVADYLAHRYTPSTGSMGLGYSGATYGDEVVLYIFPYNALHQMGNYVDLHITIGTNGIEDAATADCHIYPNPATSMLNISGSDIQRVELYNMAGQRVSSLCSGSDTLQLDVSTLAHGTYVLKVFTSHGMSSQKVVVD